MDGKALGARIRAEVAREVADLGRPVGLATVLVGDDPASAIYVSSKRKACAEAGIESFHHELQVRHLGVRAPRPRRRAEPGRRVTGILTQLPLPPHVDEEKVIQAIDPLKDVDGFHPDECRSPLPRAADARPGDPSGVMELLARVRRRARRAPSPSSSDGRISSGSPGAPAPRKARDGDDLPQPHARPRRGRPQRRTSSSPRWGGQG